MYFSYELAVDIHGEVVFRLLLPLIPLTVLFSDENRVVFSEGEFFPRK